MVKDQKNQPGLAQNPSKASQWFSQNWGKLLFGAFIITCLAISVSLLYYSYYNENLIGQSTSSTNTIFVQTVLGMLLLIPFIMWIEYRYYKSEIDSGNLAKFMAKH